MYAEPLINRAKDDNMANRRLVFSYLQNKYAVTELFREIAQKIADRPGGYTRILKTGNRLGDNARCASLSSLTTTKTCSRPRTRRRPAVHAVRASLPSLPPLLLLKPPRPKLQSSRRSRRTRSSRRRVISAGIQSDTDPAYRVPIRYKQTSHRFWRWLVCFISPHHYPIDWLTPLTPLTSMSPKIPKPPKIPIPFIYSA